MVMGNFPGQETIACSDSVKTLEELWTREKVKCVNIFTGVKLHSTKMLYIQSK